MITSKKINAVSIFMKLLFKVKALNRIATRCNCLLSNEINIIPHITCIV